MDIGFLALGWVIAENGAISSASAGLPNWPFCCAKLAAGKSIQL